ncbi:TPA: ABC transporter permease [Vibrio parahaemolyticus]|uniref:ABC transporter permease n=1 Tax=Vibrio parahaemolyticus TaxID=670 RepID=UPI00186A71DB|nr:FtsX-like permease family protein [Vibrio parahaemolyticus]EGR3412713.1 ABC transporter permease [Vibrio parahaemolyticus]EJG1864928.1 ABC transporter permease [Vibrio parahaemolyticus]EKA4546685.1 ABC transporter permease [Vibrio parahaemolyticus]ELB2251945.1 ABC transporter permease [Vibrio parahaemolyticus]MBE4036004.1 ABC transporter permease [Vibrio parahaemolyticus]
MLIKLAWRNLWRQKRRTLLTAAALALVLFLSLLTRAFQEGSYSSNIKNAAKFYTGLIQLQNPEFGDSSSIDDVLPQTDAFISASKANSNIDVILPRVESFALAAKGERSKGVMVLGVDPESENAYSHISDKLVQGEFIASGQNAVLVGGGLAQYLRLKIGDELVLYGAGYRGQTAAELYRVAGILHFPLQQLDSQLVYMPLDTAQTLYSLDKQVTAWVLNTSNLRVLPSVIEQLKRDYGNSVAVKGWQELSPELSQQIALDKAGGIFLIYILYGIVGFGLFATILMTTLERQREFAVMLATGMLRSKLIGLISIESLFIAIIGIVLGLIVSAPVLGYFYFNPIEITGEAAQVMLESGFEPIVPVSLDPHLLLNQIIVVLIILSLCLVYPMIRLLRLPIASGLKGGAHVD